MDTCARTNTRGTHDAERMEMPQGTHREHTSGACGIWRGDAGIANVRDDQRIPASWDWGSSGRMVLMRLV